MEVWRSSAGNANFAWVQHLIYHLAPAGIAGFVLANGSMSSNQSGEGEIRKSLIEADLVDCMIALPGQLFYGSPIPVCLWFVTRTKANGKLADRRGKVLFVDARKMGVLVDRVHRELTSEEIAHITRIYHAWRGEKGAGKYQDIAGFCKSASLAEIHHHGYVLPPGRYVGAEEVEDDDEPFEDKMKRLKDQLDREFADGDRLENLVRSALGQLKMPPRQRGREGADVEWRPCTIGELCDEGLVELQQGRSALSFMPMTTCKRAFL